MANVEHSTLTDPYIHEPKGASTATVGKVYIADGAGSGVWTDPSKYLGAYIPFDASTPAYQHSATTSDTVINPSFTVYVNSGFTAASSPNARIVYSDTLAVTCKVILTLSTKQASGTSRDVEWAIYKNGSVLPGSRTIRTISSGTWGSISVTGFTDLVTDDYLEVFSKASAACTVDYASGFLSISGVPT